MKFNINLNSNPEFVKNFQKFCEDNEHLIEDVKIIHLSEGRFNFIIEAEIWKLDIPNFCQFCRKDRNSGECRCVDGMHS